MRARIYGLHSGDYQFRYVGWTNKTIEKRLAVHKARASSGARWRVSQWIRKHPSTVKVELLEEIEGDKSDVLLAEKKWIAVLDTFRSGLNMTEGGEGTPGVAYSVDRRETLSRSLTGRTFSETHRLNLSKSLIGRKRNPESVEKMRKSLTGNKYPEAGPKISAKLTGRKRTQKECEAISAGLKGRVPTDEERQKCIIGVNKRYTCSECGYESNASAVSRHINKLEHGQRIAV